MLCTAAEQIVQKQPLMECRHVEMSCHNSHSLEIALICSSQSDDGCACLCQQGSVAAPVHNKHIILKRLDFAVQVHLQQKGLLSMQ